MKRLLVAVSLALAAPTVAHAETTIVSRDVPLHGERVLSAAAPEFNLVGLHWRGRGSVSFRTRALDGRWSSWHAAAPEAEDAPDHPVEPGWNIGNPYWTGASDAIAYRLHGHVTRVRAFFVWSPVDALPVRRLAVAGSPPLITRSAWGADESIRRAAPRYADAVRFAVVHHTAGTNAYSASQSAAIVRGIEVYHVKGNGWNDIGYNFLVDRYGQVFEGRFGGVDKNVIGAHAEGFNTGSVGVAVLGTYDSAPPSPAAQQALENLLAWRLDIAHVNPVSTVVVPSGGNARFPAGMPVFLRAVSGHRDTGFTSCPGNALYAELGSIAENVATDGLPKLYAPTVHGQPGGTVEFRATLSTPLTWTVTVADPAGHIVGSGAGLGADVDWVWDASKLPAARYSWTISAGPDVRPASGFVGAAPIPLALKGAAAVPSAISPNGDGVSDRAKVVYTLSTSADVTAVLRTAEGRQLATLFSERRSAGKHTFTFSADGIADGRYVIALSATDGKTTVAATVPVIVDRTFGSFRISPLAVSPNGDGRNDLLNTTFVLSQPATINVSVKQSNRAVDDVVDGRFQAGSQRVQWDGSAGTGRARDGTYADVVTVTTPTGTTAHSLLFRIDTVAPRLRIVSLRPLALSVTERATLHVVANGRAHVLTSGPGVIRLGGRARHVRAYAVDSAGNVSRTLRR